MRGSWVPHLASTDWSHQQPPIKEKSMHKLVRTGIVTLAGTVVLGTAGVAIAGGAQAKDGDKVVKREDTSTSWVQSTNLDDDPDDDQAGKADSPTHHTVNTTPTTNTHNTANTANTSPTTNTANTAPTKNTVKTVNTAPTKNTAPTANTN